ncbi:hypothetical protein KI387_023415, partial [Taxus chinensis]
MNIRLRPFTRRIATMPLKSPPILADKLKENHNILNAIDNTIIKMCTEGQLREALVILQNTIHPLHYETYASLLQSCALFKTLRAGKKLHSLIITSGLGCHEFVSIKLCGMYCRCQSLEDARQVFDKMAHRRKPILWNVIIRGYARRGFYAQALELYNEMQDEGISPDTFTFACALMACASLSDLKQGRDIHDCIISRQLESDIYVGNALVAMYAKCGSLEKALELFDNMSQRDVVSWNSIISAYAQYGRPEDAMKFLSKMYLAGMKPEIITIVSVLPACGNMEALQNGKEIHGFIIKMGYEADDSVGNSLLSMYAKCGCLEDAQEIFETVSLMEVVSWNAMITGYGQNGHYDVALKLLDQMVFTGLKPNVITWSAIIRASAQNGYPEKAFEFYGKMQMEGVEPDCVTLVSVLGACSQLECQEKGKAIHGYVRANGFDSETMVGNALISMYGKCAEIESSRLVFDKMYERDAISWSAMIAAYVQRGH